MKLKIIEKELSYKIVGILYDIHNSYGRYCAEKQYADILAKKLKENNLKFQREFPVVVAERKSSFIDFIIEDRLLLELKSQPFLTRKDYYQVKKYLELLDFEIGLLVNFKSKYLSPKRILNSKYSNYLGNSDKFVNLDYIKGVAALPAIMVIAMVILLVGVGISSTGFIENLSSYGELENKKALAAAEAGAQDAFEKLVRNRSCSGNCANYTLEVGDADADVEISNNDANSKKIVSTGRVGFKRVKIQVIVSFDANNEASSTSWQEITD
jgi:GxxExxY protein